MKIAIILLILGILTPGSVVGQEVDRNHSTPVEFSLEEAVTRGLEANETLLAQRSRAEAKAQLPLLASPALLPSLSVGIQGMRTTDPVGVFGLKLRQENFAMEDLALDALNRPDPYSGFNASATLQIPLLVPEGIYGFKAARKVAEAERAGARRAAGATRFFIVQAYTGALLAAGKVEALDAALTAVEAHVFQAEAMRDQGLVTGLDARMAALRASEIEIRRLVSQAEAENAISTLKALLALPEGVELTLTDELAESQGSSTCISAATDCSWESRGDLQAYSAGVEAASNGVKMAWAAQLPTLGAFGALGHYAHDSPFGNGSGDWTFGIGISWTPFRGVAGVGAVRAARAEEAMVQAEHEAAFRQAEVEVLQARRMLDAAEKGARVAGEAAGEARIALEQARLRYQTGTSPISELLDVQAAATNATLSGLAARRDLVLAHAALDLAYGVFDR